MDVRTVGRQDLFRHLAGTLLLCGTPSFLLCTFSHWCMDGHMAHPPYAVWHQQINDAVWIVAFGLAAICSLRSNMRSRAWLTASIAVTAMLAECGGHPLNFPTLGAALVIAIRGFVSRDSSTLPPGSCESGDSLSDNVGGECSECEEYHPDTDEGTKSPS